MAHFLAPDLRKALSHVRPLNTTPDKTLIHCCWIRYTGTDTAFWVQALYMAITVMVERMREVIHMLRGLMR